MLQLTHNLQNVEVLPSRHHSTNYVSRFDDNAILLFERHMGCFLLLGRVVLLEMTTKLSNALGNVKDS